MRKALVSISALFILILAACGGNSGPADGGIPDAAGDAGVQDVGPITRPPTTVNRTVKPKLALDKLDRAQIADFGLYTMDGPGEPHLLRNDLEVVSPGPEKQRSILYVTHITDTHVVDYQSPNRVVQWANAAIDGAFKTEEGYSVEVLDRLIHTVNGLSKFRRFDAFIHTGDGIDNNQANELSWLLNTLGGKPVNTDSGGYEFTGDLNICQQIVTEGLDTNVPWYYAFGNHDELLVGNSLPVSRKISVAEQNEQIKTCTTTLEAIGTSSPAIIKCPADVLKLNPYLDDPDGKALPKGTVNSSADRIHITHNQFITGLFNDTSNPAGHGITQENLDKDNGNFTAVLVKDGKGAALVRLIVLDLSFAGEGNSVYASGFLYKSTFDWLVLRLEEAKTNNELVIMASHHPSYSLDGESEVSGSTLVSKILEYPNVVLHLVGHGHHNNIDPHMTFDASKPGYWEVQTTFTIAFPQQVRLVELVDDGDGTGSIYTTMLDHDSVQTNPSTGSMTPSWWSRQVAIREIQMGHILEKGHGEITARNTRLKFKIPPGVQERVAAMPEKEVESLNF